MKQSWGAAAIVVAILLSGCSSPAAPSKAPEPDPITDPADFNGSADGRPHVHDYWRGSKELTLLDETFSLSFPSEQSVVLAPPEGFTVYPGARWLNITATYDYSGIGGSNSLYVSYYDASGEQVQQVELLSGEILTVNTTDATNDPPHSQVSRWSFEFAAGGTGTMDVEVEITIARPDGPLPFAPPHPDYWGNATRLTSFDHEGRLFMVANMGAAVEPGAQANDVGMRFVDPRIVPPFTEQIEILFFFNSSSPDALHVDPVLDWHGADSRDYTETNVAPEKPAPGLYKWSIDVVPDQWDSPYVNDTLWALDIKWFGQPPNLLTYMDGDMHLVIRLHRTLE